MALKIRRGTDSQRGGITFASGELIWTTNTHRLFVGDGVTPGGIDTAAQLGGTGISYNPSTGRLDLNLAGTNTDSLSEGTNNRYFTPARATQAVATALTNGNSYNSGITFLYDDVDNRITATVNANLSLPNQTGNAGKYLSTDGVGNLSWSAVTTAVVNDTSPNLGGNLSLNNHNITGTGNINITGNITASGDITNTGSILSGYGLPTQTFERSSRVVNIGKNSSPGTLWVKTDANAMVIDGLTTGTTTSGILGKISRGTLSSRSTILPGDPTMFMEGWGYNGTDYQFTGAVIAAADPGATFTNGPIPGSIGLIVSDVTGNPLTAIFDSNGAFSAPRFLAGDGTSTVPSIAFSTDGGKDSGLFHPGDGIVCVSINAVEKARFDSGGMRVGGFMKVGGFATGSLPAPAEAGMIVLDTTTGQFKGYNGTSWVVLG